MATGPLLIHNSMAIAAANAIADLVDGGVGSNGLMEVRSGTVPASLADADTGTMLASISFNATAFADAINAAPGGRVSVNGVPISATATATGIATYFRVKNKAGIVVIQGRCGVTGSGEHAIINRTDITSGGEVILNSLNMTMPESF